MYVYYLLGFMMSIHTYNVHTYVVIYLEFKKKKRRSRLTTAVLSGFEFDHRRSSKLLYCVEHTYIYRWVASKNSPRKCLYALTVGAAAPAAPATSLTHQRALSLLPRPFPLLPCHHTDHTDCSRRSLGATRNGDTDSGGPALRP